PAATEVDVDDGVGAGVAGVVGGGVVGSSSVEALAAGSPADGVEGRAPMVTTAAVTRATAATAAPSTASHSGCRRGGEPSVSLRRSPPRRRRPSGRPSGYP